MWIVLSLVFHFLIKLRFPTNKSIAHVIRSRYGQPTLCLIRKFETIDLKLRKAALDIEFLETCIKHDLIPKFVQFKVANRNLQGSKAYKQCQKKLLQQELNEKKHHQKTLQKNINHFTQLIRNNLSIIDFAHISSKFLIKNNRSLNRIRMTQEKKLLNLGLRTAVETNDPEKVIFNFSSRILTSAEKSLLAKGLNLAIPPKQLNHGDFLQPFESLFKELHRTQAEFEHTNISDPIGATMRDAAFECLNSYDPKHEQNLSKDDYQALQSLLKDENIVIQKSDKGNSVVILNKRDYLNRMEELLSDTSKFKRLRIKKGCDYNHIANQEIRISKALRDIRNRGAMLEALYQDLNPTGTQPSVMYGLSKIHKPTVNNVPNFRPILSAVNSPTYKLSKYMNKLLKPFTTNQYTTKDSFAFATDINLQDSSLYMSSLDVDSLFTNISLKEVIKICSSLLFRDQPIVDGLMKEDFEELLTLATTESFILFNARYYQQIDGVAMGSPLGPTLANIFLCHKEEQWLNNCPHAFKPIYYRRYVDDIFVLLPHSGCLEDFRNYMSNQHQNINFSSEGEADGSLPFLDVFISRHQSIFITSVYRKPTFSGVYTNFDSYIPSIYKASLVSTLVHRSFTICTSWKLIHLEIVNIKSLLTKNSFPAEFVDKIVSIFLNRMHSTNKNANDNIDKEKTTICVLPFLGTYTKRPERELNRQSNSTCLASIFGSSTVLLPV